MVEYSCETIGYYSVINGVLEDPVYKTLNIDAVKKINHGKIQLDCSRQAPIAKNKDTVEHLLEFLESKNHINNLSNKNEFNILGQAYCLLKLLTADSSHKEPMKFEFYRSRQENTILVEENKCVNLDAEVEDKLTVPGEAVERLLALLPNGTRERIPRLYPLFIVVKHKYVFPNGMTINLFVSKEIHSVIEHTGVLSPIDLKYNIHYMVSTAQRLNKHLWKAMIMSFLAGGLSHFIAVSIPQDNCIVDRVGLETFNKEEAWLENYKPFLSRKLIIVVIDDKTVLCKGTILAEFTQRLRHLIRKLVQLNCDGQLMKLPQMPQDIMIATEPNTWTRLFSAAPTFSESIKDVTERQDGDHELVIIGTCKTPIAYSKHFYNADFISLKHFCEVVYAVFMQVPKCIKLYGTNEEYETIQNYVTDVQLNKLIRATED